MIELLEVSKIYDRAIVAADSISFEVGKGEVFGLVGTSGCGKTTTLKMINRLIEPTSGRIYMDGESVLDHRPEELRRRIGYVIQGVGLFPHYTIEQNVSIVPKLLEWDEKRVEQRSRELLELVGLDVEEFGGRKPEALSGGQQQRVGLARALAGDPEVLLMDEPFGALDPITKEQVRNEFSELLQKIEKTVILVTHDVFEAFELCDRICLMDGGKVQQVGTPQELIAQPANDFVRSFFDSHRFQLEMMSVSIAEILPYLSHELTSSKDPGQDATIIDADASLFSVLEHIGSESDICLKSSDGGNKMVALNIEELLIAFREWRKLQRDRHD